MMAVILRDNCRCCKRYGPVMLDDHERAGLCINCGHCCQCHQLRRLDMMEPYGKCAACLGIMDRLPQDGDPPGSLPWQVQLFLFLLFVGFCAYVVPLLLAWMFLKRMAVL